MNQGDACIRELKRRQLPLWLVPPIFRIAWRYDVNVSAPFYWNTTAKALFLGIPLATAMFAFLLALDVYARQSFAPLWFYIAAASGLAFAAIALLCVACYFYREKLATMPKWEEL